VEERARSLMGDALYDYVASGAADEITLRWNIEKYRELKLRPRALQNVLRAMQFGINSFFVNACDIKTPWYAWFAPDFALANILGDNFITNNLWVVDDLAPSPNRRTATH
jgi:hypothetical protein